MRKSEKILNLIIPLISVLCIVVLWIVLALVVDNIYLMPGFFTTIKEVFRLFATGEFYSAFLGTILRTLISFVVALSFALVLSVLTFENKRVKSAVAPIISIIRVLPTIAVVLLLLVWTNSFVAPIVVTFLVVFPTIYLNIESAIKSIDYDQVECSKTFGADDKYIFKNVVFPQILPNFFSAVGAGLSLNLKLMVAAEVLALTVNSMGNLLQLAKLYDQMVTMMALVLVTVIFGLIIEGVFSYISKKVGE